MTRARRRLERAIEVLEEADFDDAIVEEVKSVQSLARSRERLDAGAGKPTQS